MAITIIRKPITNEELKRIAEGRFGNFAKAVVDVERGVMAIGGELHADEEVALSEGGSKREHTWGINLYPENSGDEFIEFDSMVNVKPHFGNRSRDVDDPAIREKIKAVVYALVTK